MRKTLLPKRGSNRVLLAFSLALSLCGCYYDHADQLYGLGGSTGGGMGPVGPCDTAMVVSFTGDLTPILAASCTPCHSGGSPEGGLDLTLHSSVAQSGTDGNLVARMRLPMTDMGFMPRNGAPLPECDIVLFESWIAQGALDN